MSFLNAKRLISVFKFCGLGLLLLWAMTYTIHSSEFWSIALSKSTFNLDFLSSISMKPLFHFLLYLFHQLPLSNVQHLYSVKLFFGLIGIFQVFLIIEIFKKFIPVDPADTSKASPLLKQTLFFLFILTSQIYLQNFFRVRSDQLCITLFLFFIYQNQKKILPLYIQLAMVALYPVIALKGVLFSFLHGLHLFSMYKQSSFAKKNILLQVLFVCAVLIWTINFGWSALLYFLNTLQDFSSSFSDLGSWIKADAAMIGLCLISCLHLNYQSEIKKKIRLNLSLISFLSLLIIILFPQKHSYFLASFIPLFLLNSATFVLYVYENKLTSLKKKILSVGLFFFFSFQLASYLRQSPYRSNFEQFKFIQFTESLISQHNLSYLDGFGALPRENKLNCFVSPNDDLSNESCLNLIKNGEPDLIILTQRLVWLIGPSERLNHDYTDVGSNIFINKKLDLKIPPGIPPALFVFGFEN